jgi:hypothetical protein
MHRLVSVRNNPTSRVAEGFHRLGIALALPLLLIAGTLAFKEWVEPTGAWFWAGSLAALAVVLYLKANVVGWVVRVRTETRR